LTYEQFDALCAQICAADSQLKHKESRRAAWTGWKGDRITWQKRNEFIRANGGIIADIQSTGKLTGKWIKKLK
jgi:hypothetical protein